MTMKIAGIVKYMYGVISPNDTSGVGLGYNTLEQAQLHADTMNSKISLYDIADNTYWNKSHWQVKPEPFVVERL